MCVYFPNVSSPSPLLFTFNLTLLLFPPYPKISNYSHSLFLLHSIHIFHSSSWLDLMVAPALTKILLKWMKEGEKNLKGSSHGEINPWITSENLCSHWIIHLVHSISHGLLAQERKDKYFFPILKCHPWMETCSVRVSINSLEDREGSLWAWLLGNVTNQTKQGKRWLVTNVRNWSHTITFSSITKDF